MTWSLSVDNEDEGGKKKCDDHENHDVSPLSLWLSFCIKGKNIPEPRSELRLSGCMPTKLPDLSEIQFQNQACSCQTTLSHRPRTCQ